MGLKFLYDKCFFVNFSDSHFMQAYVKLGKPFNIIAYSLKPSMVLSYIVKRHIKWSISLIDNTLWKWPL